MAELSISQARRLSLGAQGFGVRRPSGRVDRRHIRSTMQRLQLLQLDSVPAVIRTQYMPLFSRLGPYRTELLDELAYRDHEWFEAWSHEASLLPVDSEPLLRWHKRRVGAGETWQGLVELARREQAYVQSVLDEIAARGPLRANELSDPRPQAGEWWDGRSIGTRALDWLFRIGAVGVRRVGNFEKQYDLFDRVVPEEVRMQPTPGDADALRELLTRAGKALGVGTADDIVDYFRLPPRLAKPLLRDVIDDGNLVATSVEGWAKPAFRHPDVPLPRQLDRTALVSPFDPVVWRRERAERLFDFHYRIEIYVPEAKRRYGYYVLPLLWGDRLAGRFDLRTLRDEGVLHVKGSYAEDWVDVGDLAPLAHAELCSLAELVGAHSLRIEMRGNLAGALAALQ